MSVSKVKTEEQTNTLKQQKSGFEPWYFIEEDFYKTIPDLNDNFKYYYAVWIHMIGYFSTLFICRYIILYNLYTVSIF